MSQEAKILTGIGLLTVIIVVAAAFFMGGTPTPDQGSAKAQVLSQSDSKILQRKDSHELTGKSAKLTIVEFGDFQCPACGDAQKVLLQFLEGYKDKVNFVFREYPLPMHKNGGLAAKAAEAAGGQGKFWEMHDKLYATQSEWSDKDNALEIFTKYAADMGLDTEKFKSDVQNDAYAKTIAGDVADGNQLKLDATPTFFLNGVRKVGVIGYDDFKKQLAAVSKTK